jgi:hypothetical protein
LAELAAVKSTMPPKTAALLGKIPDPQQYPVAAPDGGATGNTSNCAPLGARSRHLAVAVKELVYAEGARFLSNKTAAFACEAALPRRINPRRSRRG